MVEVQGHWDGKKRSHIVATVGTTLT